MPLHPLLARQLRKAAAESPDGKPDLDMLLGLVDDAYREADQVAERNQHAFKLMSDEMLELNEAVEREAEEAFSAIIRNVGEGVIVTDEDLSIEMINPAAESIFGVASDALAGMPLSTLLPDTADRLLTGDKTDDYCETARRHSDGTGLRVVATFGTFKHHGLSRHICIVRDMSEGYERERKLREQATHLQAVLDNATQGILMVGADGTLTACNAHIEKIINLPEGTLRIGDTLNELVRRAADGWGDDPTRRSVRKAFWQSFLSRDTEKEIERDTPDGRTLKVRLKPLAEGGFVFSVADITARKAVEAELRAAKDAAETASRMKSEFLANMSHELRTPLNAIIGFSETMVEQVMGPLSDTYRGYAHDIHNSGKHLLELITDLLDLSKIEAGKFELAEEEIHLANVIEVCRRFIEGQAAIRGVDLIVERANAPRVWADERAMRQIFINLMSNAVKFTNRGGCVTVSVFTRDDGGVSARVHDTGIGMAAADIPRALQPFEQVSSAMTRSQPGTGLGLPLVKSLAELHDGTLKLESMPDVGTTVEVNLPAWRTRYASGETDDAAEFSVPGVTPQATGS